MPEVNIERVDDSTHRNVNSHKKANNYAEEEFDIDRH